MKMDPKKVLSKLELTKLQKESDKLLELYNQQNAAAAKKAIAAKDWAVLKVAFIHETISNFWLKTILKESVFDDNQLIFLEIWGSKYCVSART